MILLALVLVGIGLSVGWYVGRSYYTHTTKLFILILIILIAFASSWLALQNSHTLLWESKPSWALWSGFGLSSLIACISLLRGSTCQDNHCRCRYGGSCSQQAVDGGSEVIAASSSPDDLKVIEGIGPVIEKHLNSNNIWTYEQLADIDPIHLKNILDRAGDRLAVHDPSTRPTQAVFARDNNLTELVAFQETLKAGRA